MGESTGAIEREAVDLRKWTVRVVAAYVSKNSIPAAQLMSMISVTHAAVARLGGRPEAPATRVDLPTPTQIRASITPAALISFEDGRHYKTLRRHLSCLTLTPEAYRAKWGLPEDYPMTAPEYSARRSALAKSFGLGSGHRVQKIRNAQAASPNASRHLVETGVDRGADV